MIIAHLALCSYPSRMEHFQVDYAKSKMGQEQA